MKTRKPGAVCRLPQSYQKVSRETFLSGRDQKSYKMENSGLSFDLSDRSIFRCNSQRGGVGEAFERAFKKIAPPKKVTVHRP
jgi:hypothetical protein